MEGRGVLPLPSPKKEKTKHMQIRRKIEIELGHLDVVGMIRSQLEQQGFGNVHFSLERQLGPVLATCIQQEDQDPAGEGEGHVSVATTVVSPPPTPVLAPVSAPKKNGHDGKHRTRQKRPDPRPGYLEDARRWIGDHAVEEPFTTQDLAHGAGIEMPDAGRAISIETQNGRIKRIERGVYYVPRRKGGD